MNFSFKIIFLFLFPLSLQAVELTSYYLTSCRREIGFTLGVKNHSITMLNINGEILEIPRYDVIALAKYPVDKLPIEAVSGFKDLHVYHYVILTKFKRDLVPLVSGWPINFSKNKISFISLQGEEVAIARDAIWEIQRVPSENHATFINGSQKDFKFVHPVALNNCPYEDKFTKQTVNVTPNEFVTDSVAIKRRLDRVSSEQDKIESYVRKKKFYAIPQVYTNQSTLGFWMVQGSRYGASNSRENNGAPILETQFSDGPFGFQSTSLSGSGPNKYLLHEEAQTQFFYRFKADYFHLGFFFDPNVILVGSKYKWQEEDLETRDDRLFEATMMELGLDFGHFSIISVVHSSARFALTDEVYGFRYGNFNFPRYGVSYQNHLFTFQVFYGSEDHDSYKFEKQYNFDFTRVNIDYRVNKQFEIQWSLINLKVEDVELASKISTLTNAFYLTYNYNFKYQIAAMLSLERKDFESFNYSNFYIKSGAKFSIRF